MRDQEGARSVGPEVGAGGYSPLHNAGGEDDAGLEIAQRKVEWHRDVLQENAEQLHHTATGDLPGESPRRPAVFVRNRRGQDSSRVLLTLIEIGEAGTPRPVAPGDPAAERPRR